MGRLEAVYDQQDVVADLKRALLFAKGEEEKKLLQELRVADEKLRRLWNEKESAETN